MEVTQDVEIARPAEQVWSILDEQFGSISTWAARMRESQWDDNLGELGGRQVVTVEYGPATETLYLRDRDARALGYWVTGASLPPPISQVQTEWRVTDLDSKASRVHVRFLAVVTPPEMQPMLEETLRGGLTPLLDELRHFAETGEPHPNKTQTEVRA